MKFPEILRGYMTYVLPIVIVAIYLKGYFDLFYAKGMAYFIPWMLVAVGFLALVGYFIFYRKKEKMK